MSTVLVYSERQDLALELLSGGRDVAAARGATLAVALLGDSQTGWADDCFAHGAAQAFAASHDALADTQTDTVAAALAQIAAQAGADLILIGSSRRGRTLAPRLAQKLGAGCVTDASRFEMDGATPVTKRVALGGNTLKEEAITAPVAVIAVSPGTFEASPGGNGGKTVMVALDLPESQATTTDTQAKSTGAANIEQAAVVVCMGRGLASQDDIPMVEALAQALGGEIAGTRPLAYELGWLSEDRMIGISGKSVSPVLYVAVGLSGQIQHAVSIRDSKIILAINKDKNAPIFQMADYGIVGDLYDIVPGLAEALGG